MSRGRTFVRASATATAAGVLLLSAAPAMAADVVAQAEGEAASLSIGGQSLTDQVGGPYRAERTEDGQRTTGTNTPRANLIDGQQAVSIGTLAQDAATSLQNGRGSSAACAGVAGDGATLLAVSNSAEFCLDGGDSASLTAGRLDLSDIIDTDLLTPPGGADGLPTNLRDLLVTIPGAGGALADAIDTVNEQLQTALAPFEDAGLVLNLGVLQSQCTAGPGPVADGSARLADAGAVLRFPDASPVQEIPLLTFEPDPAPNTNVATDIDDLVDLIAAELADSLTASGLPAEVAAALEQIRTQVKENLTSQLADQLGPLDENVISGTLNKQKRSRGEIEVTALDLQVLPVLQGQAGFSAVDAQLARSQCGPSGNVGPEPGPGPSTPPSPPVGDTTPNPDVPTSVPAGLADDGEGFPVLPLAALVTLATAAGLVVHRRASRA